jgi:hypothetical protein
MTVYVSPGTLAIQTGPTTSTGGDVEKIFQC